MDARRLIDALERGGPVLAGALRGTPEADARWRPDGGGWSILEIAGHLADEEVSDFRPRLRLTLADPEADWPPIDPEGWAVERRYNEQDLEQTVARFENARRESIGWLRGLKGPDWSATHAHRRLGSMRAGDLLAAWAAHDTLHLRQIAKRHYQLICRDGAGFKADYAGTWRT